MPFRKPAGVAQMRSAYKSMAISAAFLGCLCGHASQSRADFDAGAALAMCTKVSKAGELSAEQRKVVINVCMGAEQRNAQMLEHKRKFVPSAMYARCVATSGSYSDASDCIDRAVLDLPRGSVQGIWRLQNSPKGERIFWYIEECNSARVEDRGGDCVSEAPAPRKLEKARK
jgi:hypothetical protein